MTNTEFKQCNKCEFFRKSKDANYADKCHHPDSMYDQDPITGAPSYATALFMRKHEAHCGKDAKYFVPIATVTVTRKTGPFNVFRGIFGHD